MTETYRGSKPLAVVFIILAFLICTFIVFTGSLPESYSYAVGSVAETDIYATRSFIDTYATEYQAVIARNSVTAIFVKSDEISDENVTNVETFFDLTNQVRELRANEEDTTVTTVSSAATLLKSNVSDTLGIDCSKNDLNTFLLMSDSTFSYMRDKAVSMAELIMIEEVTEADLETAIDSQISDFKDSNPSYSSYADAVSNVFKLLLQPNSVFDSEATDEASEIAYQNAMSDAVTVEKGTKIVTSGEVITEHTYQMLVDLELIRNDAFNYVILARTAIYVLLVFVVAIYYLIVTRRNRDIEPKIVISLIVTFLIPVFAALYLSEFSNVISIVLFFTVICATYMSLVDGIIISFANLLVMWPVYDFEIENLVVYALCILVCASVTGNTEKKYSSAKIILLPTLTAILSTLSYDFLSGVTQNEYVTHLLYVSVGVVFSLVFAVGSMPIYELLANPASPVRLIELSQPGSPLLKRLFLEASGTYQHSLMVANLSDSAADAIGADSLLCKVAAYYHDIGKLEAPTFFTENQSDGINPHDSLPVMESVRIITSHPKDGIALAKKYRLPGAIIKVIDEHHGTTYPAYFYRKACDEAKANGMEMPDVENFRYPGHIPSSRESAIIMLADTCEAAIRSKKVTDINECENLIRTLVKSKIEQDQLINSGLSFDDIEKIILAFRQVYSGAMHERIQYPE